MTNLADRLDNFPEAWKPKNAGEQLQLLEVPLRCTPRRHDRAAELYEQARG